MILFFIVETLKRGIYLFHIKLFVYPSFGFSHVTFYLCTKLNFGVEIIKLKYIAAPNLLSKFKKKVNIFFGMDIQPNVVGEFNGIRNGSMVQNTAFRDLI